MSISENTGRNSMSEIIMAAARQTVEQTQEAIRLAEGKEIGEDAVTIMVNGEETKLNLSDYELLKQKNREVHLRMKEQLRALVHD